MDILRFHPEQDPAGHLSPTHPDRAGQGIEPVDPRNPASPTFWAGIVAAAAVRNEIPTALAPPRIPIQFSDPAEAERHEQIRLRAAQVEARHKRARRDKQRRDSPFKEDYDLLDGPQARPAELNVLLQSVLARDNLDPNVRALVEGIQDYSAQIPKEKIPVRQRLIQSLFRVSGRPELESAPETGPTIIPGSVATPELGTGMQD